MDAIFLQILNGLDKGGAYALIALGLTLDLRHARRGQLRAWRAVHARCVLRRDAQQPLPQPPSKATISETKKDFLGNPLKVRRPYLESWFGPEVGDFISTGRCRCRSSWPSRHAIHRLSSWNAA
jgi:branched-chain amino acid transport system permease protein